MPSHRDFNARISDWPRCPYCVSDDRLGYASAYFNSREQLFAVCKRHAVKWYMSRALLHPTISDLSQYPDLVAAFDHTEPFASTMVELRSTPDSHTAARKGPRRRKPSRRPASRPVSYVLQARPQRVLLGAEL
jgi:hypothetical protein